MKTAIDNAIKLLTGRIDDSVEPGEALKITQAALNLAHVYAVLNANQHAGFGAGETPTGANQNG